MVSLLLQVLLPPSQTTRYYIVRIRQLQLKNELSTHLTYGCTKFLLILTPF